MKRNKFETQVRVAEGLGDRWVTKSGETIEREGEHTPKCAWVSISMYGFL
jgi:hypothetical protein